MIPECALQPDDPIRLLADYVTNPPIPSKETLDTALLCLSDAIASALMALQSSSCRHLIKPLIREMIVPHGCRIVGTDYVVGPMVAAFQLGTMVSWLDYNDAFIGAQTAYPSDCLAPILATADYRSRQMAAHKEAPTIGQLLLALVHAYELHWLLCSHNSLSSTGLDPLLFAKVASTAVCCRLMGGTYLEICSAISQAWVDLCPMYLYHFPPSVGPRKAWSSGDTASRSILLALMAKKGEPGYPQALSMANWGFYDLFRKGEPFFLEKGPQGSAMANVCFRPRYPGQLYGQTAIEAAIELHPHLRHRLGEIDQLLIETHPPALELVHEGMPLRNSAQRDHSLSYMLAVAILRGTVLPSDYEDKPSVDALIDQLQGKMRFVENPQFSRDWLDPNKRSLASSLSVLWKDGTQLGPYTVEYPLGHPRRRREALPFLREKRLHALRQRFDNDRVETIMHLMAEREQLQRFPVSAFLDLFYVAES